jgi:SNF2 family DNA or RNA helicase
MSFELLAWQKEAVVRGLQNKNLAILAEMGTGKTFTAISIIMNRLKEMDLRVLVICPPVVIKNWKDEIAKFYPNYPQNKILTLDADARKKNPDLTKYQIIVTNYHTFSDRTKKYNNLFKNWKPHLVVLDESHQIKSHTSLRTKNIIEFCKDAPYKYILSGTPILNGPMDAYSQFLFLDNGETLGNNFFVFRATYFYNVMEGRGVTFPKYVPIKSKLPILSEKIMTKAVRVTLKECTDLPPLIKHTFKVPMHESVRKIYKELKEEFITMVDEEAVIAQTAMTKALRLMQICSGHYVTSEGELRTLPHNNKLDYLRDFIEDTLEIHNKIIIWCAFKHDYKIIGDMLKIMKVDHVFLTGEQSTKQKEESIQAFQHGTAQVIVANRKAGGIGTNLTAAPVSITFSKTFDLADELQSQARNYRKGSEIHEKILQYDLVYEGSVEERITKVLAEKKDLSDIIIDVNTIVNIIKEKEV